MIDCGVYAPLQKEDRRPEHITLVKNIIHEFSCECYNFDESLHEKEGCSENVFDICDDISGGIHELGRRSVLPYVNEPLPGEAETVHAADDPSGAVHYMLGYYDSDHGEFRLPTDGKEVEIYVNYG